MLESRGGILIKQFSDHHPYFIFIDNAPVKKCSPKLIKIHIQNEIAMWNFASEITNSNIMEKLYKNSLSDPNKNHKIITEVLGKAHKVTLYNALMLPYINYGLMVWGFSCNRIIKLQKKAIRIICLTNYNAHTEPLFKKLKFLNVTDMLKLHELKLYYKYVHTTLPVYLQNLPFILNKAVHIFNTRIHDNIHTNRAKHDFAK